MQVKETSLMKYVQSSDSENKLRVSQLEGEVSAIRKQVGELHAVAICNAILIIVYVRNRN